MLLNPTLPPQQTLRKASHGHLRLRTAGSRSSSSAYARTQTTTASEAWAHRVQSSRPGRAAAANATPARERGPCMHAAVGSAETNRASSASLLLVVLRDTMCCCCCSLHTHGDAPPVHKTMWLLLLLHCSNLPLRIHGPRLHELSASAGLVLAHGEICVGPLFAYSNQAGATG